MSRYAKFLGYSLPLFCGRMIELISLLKFYSLNFNCVIDFHRLHVLMNLMKGGGGNLNWWRLW